jgi:peptidoglycan/xylan/chitin deacetylase (PgdA/CDA1 family)
MQQVEEIGSAEFTLQVFAGISNRLFRFPGGCYSDSSVKLVKKANDLIVHWDVSGEDGFNKNTQNIIYNVINRVQNGSIIVLHINGLATAPKTSEALPSIISILRQRGFEFVKISDLLGLPQKGDAS